MTQQASPHASTPSKATIIAPGGDGLYGRQRQLQHLTDAFHRSRGGQLEIVSLGAGAGAGKSALIQRFGRRLPFSTLVGQSKGEAHQSRIPYRFLADAVTSLFETGTPAERDQRIAAMGKLTQEHRTLLLSAFPALAALLGSREPGEHARRSLQLKHAFVELVRGLSPPGQTLVLTLDDAQWADAGSLALLEHLAQEAERNRLLLVLAYRDNEALPSLAGFLARLRQLGVPCRAIELPPLDHEAITQAVRSQYGDAHGQADLLAKMVQRRTHGHPFGVVSFLRELRGRGLVGPSTRSKTPWDLGQIGLLATAEDPGLYWRSAFTQLSAESQQALSVAACLGVPFDLASWGGAFGTDTASVAGGLQEAAQQGFLLVDNGRYQFAHDVIRQNVYEVLPRTHAEANHRALGLAALNVEEEHGPFTAANQLNAACHDAQGPEAAVTLFDLNARSGLMALQTSAHSSAEHYLGHAVALQSKHALAAGSAWRRCLIGLAECHGMRGTFAAAERLYAQALESSTEALEKARIYASRAHVYGIADRFASSIDAGITGLRLLGDEATSNPGAEIAQSEVARLERAVGGFTAESLASLPPLTCPEALIRLDLYGAVFHAAYCQDSGLFTRNRARIMVSAFFEGRSEFSPLAFMSYAVHGICNRREVRQALPFARQSLRLMDTGTSNNAALVRFLYAAYVLQFEVSTRGVIRYMEQAMQDADAMADVNYGNIFRFELLLRYLLVGLPAEALQEQCFEFIQHAKRRTGPGPAKTMQVVLRAAECLQREHADCSLCSPQSSHLADTFGTEWAYNNQLIRLVLLYMKGHNSAALATGEALLNTLLTATLPNIRANTAIPVCCLYYGLALARSIQKSQKHGANEAQSALRQCIGELTWWSTQASPHFRGELDLLLGAQAAALGELAAAESFLGSAHRSFEEGGMVSGVAMSSELLAALLAQVGRRSAADEVRAQAVKAYADWGVPHKVRELSSSEQTDKNLSSAVKVSHEDLAALCSDIAARSTVGEVLERLVHAALQTTGASRALCVAQDAGQLQINSEKADEPLNWDSQNRVPAALMHRVLELQSPVITDDAPHHVLVAHEAYAHARRPRAIYCAPLTCRGEPRRALYLESITRGVQFDRAQCATLSMLLTQATSSIDRLVMQACLADHVRSNQHPIDDAPKRLARLERQALETQMAGGFAHEMLNILGGASMIVERALGSSATEGAPMTRLGDAAGEMMTLIDEHPDAAQRATGHELIKRLLDSALYLEDAINSVQRSTQRGMSLTHATLRYARSGAREAAYPRERVDLAEVTAAVLAEESAIAQGRGFAVEQKLARGTLITAFEPDVYAICKNLVVNARDALTASAEGRCQTLKVSVLKENGHPVLRVEDNGIGISSEQMAHIFEPFFTTKGGQGTGLGLATVKKLVELYEGAITCESQAQIGTCFEVTWPE